MTKEGDHYCPRKGDLFDSRTGVRIPRDQMVGLVCNWVVNLSVFSSLALKSRISTLMTFRIDFLLLAGGRVI